MTVSEIKLPNFPKYCKDDRSIIKFFSPFHSLVVTDCSVMLDCLDDIDDTLFIWRKWVNEEEYTECTQREFETAYTEAINKLSNL